VRGAHARRFGVVAVALVATVLGLPRSASATATPTITSKPPSPTNQTSATFKFTGSSGTVSFKCKLDLSAYSVCSSPRTYSSLPEGKHFFYVKAFDAAGIASSAASASWRIDLTPPPAPALTGIPDATTSTNVHFALSDAETGVAFRCQIDGASVTACPAGRGYWSLAEGTHTLRTFAKDAAGNVSAPTIGTWTVSFAPMPESPCGAAGTAPAIEHVVVFVLENRNFSQVIGSPGSTAAANAPFLNKLAAKCGLATNYFGITHPSLPNYMAMTAGETLFTSDCNSCASDGDSVFSQLETASLTWKTYAEEMPSACSQQDLRAVYYIRHHNPPVYFTRLAATCPNADVPLGTTDGGALLADLATDNLPSLSFVIPNNCNNSHDSCPGTANAVAQGDHWLASWIPRVVASAPYQSGNTAVFVTWDEGRGGTMGEDCLALLANDCHVVLLALNPYIASGTIDANQASHYDLLWTVEHLFGLPALGHAGEGSPRDLLADFGLVP
jgi:phosphatidylinositol-3-phosphatase